MARTNKPKLESRINLGIEPATTAKENVELDYRILVTGDFSKKEPGTHEEELKQRKPVVIKNKRDFSKAMEQVNPKLKLTIPNRLAAEGDMDVELDFKEMKDFHPDNIIQHVEPLQKLLEARKKIEKMKRLVQDPKLRKAFEKVITDDKKIVGDLMSKLGTSESEPAEKDKK